MIYKRRGEPTQLLGQPAMLPKRLIFLVDISGSMYRFNGLDKRLVGVVTLLLLLLLLLLLSCNVVLVSVLTKGLFL